MVAFAQGTFSPIGFRWEIENQKELTRQLDRLGMLISDFRIPFRPIAADFYRSNRKIFKLGSAGLYQDLAPVSNGVPATTSNYKATKTRLFGSPYPILEATGVLKKSVLNRNAQHSIFLLNRQSLEMGTNDPVGKFHQSDKPRRIIPQRKFIFIDGGPADKSQDSSINGRRERWTSIIETHIQQLVTGKI